MLSHETSDTMALENCRARRPTLVGQDLHTRNAAVIIDGDVDVLPPHAAGTPVGGRREGDVGRRQSRRAA